MTGELAFIFGFGFIAAAIIWWLLEAVIKILTYPFNGAVRAEREKAQRRSRVRSINHLKIW